MSDTYRRYGAIKRAIMQFYQPRPTGQREKHLNTLVALICGLVGGRHAHLSTIADHAPSNGAKQESAIDRFRRFLKHDRQQYQEPIYLVTTMPDLDMALAMYKKRPHIETFFSDQKSRGFHIHKSHLSEPHGCVGC